MNISQKEEFRYQYAGMALQAILTNKNLTSYTDSRSEYFRRDAVTLAVKFADALIAELDREDKP